MGRESQPSVAEQEPRGRKQILSKLKIFFNALAMGRQTHTSLSASSEMNARQLARVINAEKPEDVLHALQSLDINVPDITTTVLLRNLEEALRDTSSAEQATPEKRQTLTTNLQKIVNVLSGGDELTLAELADECKSNIRTLTPLVARLVKGGFITKRVSNKDTGKKQVTRYKITQD